MAADYWLFSLRQFMLMLMMCPGHAVNYPVEWMTHAQSGSKHPSQHEKLNGCDLTILNSGLYIIAIQ